MRFDVPKLADYSGAIQANQSMANAFSNLGNQSQDYLKMEEQKKNNEWNRAFDVQKFDLETNKYNSGLQEKADAKSANVGTLKALYPTEYGNLSNTMGNNPNLLGNVDIGNVQSYNTNIAKATKDKEDTLYQAGRDKISDGFERDRINISRQNAGKPTETERLLSIIMGGGVPKETTPQQPVTNDTQPTSQQQNPTTPPQSNIQSGMANITKGVQTENKPISQIDIVTSKNDTKFTDKDGRVWGQNPITKRQYLVEDVKPKEISMSDIEDINKSIEMANSLGYAKDKYNPSYTGMIDDRINFIKNKVGDNSQETQDYNKWAASLQSVGNAARNKSFGAALSGFDINEFAKEFPSTDAGDGTIIPKLEVRANMLKNSLSNTYNAWVDKYGKERADQYFSKLSDQSVLGKKTEQNNSSNTFSDEDILKRINGGR